MLTQLAGPFYKKYATTHLKGCDCLLAYGFRFYFTPLTGFFSPFPHGTGSLSVAKEYLALGGGPPGFPRDFTCLVVLRITAFYLLLSPKGLLPAAVELSSSIRLVTSKIMQVLQPHTEAWFGLFPLRSPLLGESSFLSFPSGTKMFQFPELLSIHYLFMHE